MRQLNQPEEAFLNDEENQQTGNDDIDGLRNGIGRLFKEKC